MYEVLTTARSDGARDRRAKRWRATLLVVMAFVSAVLPTIFIEASAGATTSVSTFSVSSNDYTSNDSSAVWYFNFTLTSALSGAAHDTIAFTFPANFNVTAASVYSLDYLFGCSSSLPTVTGVVGQVVTITLNSACNRSAGANTWIDLTGITAPAGPYTFSDFLVATSTDTAVFNATSGPFTISNPTTYSMTYSTQTTGANSTSGTQPVDGSSPYVSGSPVTVLANTGPLAFTGYTFAGWCSVNTSPGPTGCAGTHYNPGASFTILANTTLYSQWTTSTETITFYENYGLNSSTTESVVYNVANTLTTNSLARPGYIFTGWNTSTDGTGTAYADRATITTRVNVALYAQWALVRPRVGTITFNSNFSVISAASDNAQTVEGAVYGSAVTLTTNSFTELGYLFTGWNTSADGSGTPYADGAVMTLSGNPELYAQWKPLTCATGSTLSGSSCVADPGYYVSVPGATPQRCAAGTFSVGGSSTCTSCPPGTTTLGVAGSASCPTLAPPLSVVAVAGNRRARVSFTAPPEITTATKVSYTVTSNPGGLTCTTTNATSCVVTGLTNGTSYTFAVTATAFGATSGGATTPGAVKPMPSIIAVSNAGYVRVFNSVSHRVLFGFYPFGATYSGSLSIATGDLSGDGKTEIIVGAGSGLAPEVKVFDGKTGQLTSHFMTFDPNFTGGVSVATGDLNGDGKAEIIVGAGPGGGPVVGVFNAQTGKVISQFYAFSATFSGGVSVATGDVAGTGKADVIVGAGPGGGPEVKIFDGQTRQIISQFMAFQASFSGGVSVAAGDLTGNGSAEVITGEDSGVGAKISVYDVLNHKFVSTFAAPNSTFSAGVSVAAGDLNGSGKAEIVASEGSGGNAKVSVFNVQGKSIAGFYAFAQKTTKGMTVAASPSSS